MTEPVKRTTSINASPDRVLSVVTDFDRYPEWQKEVESTEILERDEQNRPIKVAMTAGAMGMKAGYTIALTYHPDGVEWHLLDGDMMTRNDSRWVFRANDEGGTDVDLEMVLGVKWALPEFMLKQLITKGVNDNLNSVKRIAETV